MPSGMFISKEDEKTLRKLLKWFRQSDPKGGDDGNYLTTPGGPRTPKIYLARVPDGETLTARDTVTDTPGTLTCDVYQPKSGVEGLGGATAAKMHGVHVLNFTDNEFTSGQCPAVVREQYGHYLVVGGGSSQGGSNDCQLINIVEKHIELTGHTTSEYSPDETMQTVIATLRNTSGCYIQSIECDACESGTISQSIRVTLIGVDFTLLQAETLYGITQQEITEVKRRILGQSHTIPLDEGLGTIGICAYFADFAMVSIGTTWSLSVHRVGELGVGEWVVFLERKFGDYIRISGGVLDENDCDLSIQFDATNTTVEIGYPPAPPSFPTDPRYGPIFIAVNPAGVLSPVFVDPPPPPPPGPADTLLLNLADSLLLRTGDKLILRPKTSPPNLLIRVGDELLIRQGIKLRLSPSS